MGGERVSEGEIGPAGQLVCRCSSAQNTLLNQTDAVSFVACCDGSSPPLDCGAGSAVKERLAGAKGNEAAGKPCG